MDENAENKNVPQAAHPEPTMTQGDGLTSAAVSDTTQNIVLSPSTVPNVDLVELSSLPVENGSIGVQADRAVKPVSSTDLNIPTLKDLNNEGIPLSDGVASGMPCGPSASVAASVFGLLLYHRQIRSPHKSEKISSEASRKYEDLSCDQSFLRAKRV